MNTPTYHIEDLETLLLQKEYSALLPEEKEFVHQHISDEQAYSQMRALLYKMIEESQDESEWTDPDPRVKQQLDTLFHSDDQNTPILPFYQQRTFWSLTGIAAIMVVAFFLFTPKNPDPAVLAENKPSTDASLPPNIDADKEAQTQNINPKEITPPPPPPEIEKIHFTTIEISEEEVSSPPSVQSMAEPSIPHEVQTVTKSENVDQDANISRAESQTTYSNVQQNPRYTAGDAQLQKDLENIVQNCLQNLKWDQETPPFKMFLQLNISSNGKVQSAVTKKGGESYPALCKMLETEIKQLGPFILDPQANRAQLVVPVQIDWK